MLFLKNLYRAAFGPPTVGALLAQLEANVEDLNAAAKRHEEIALSYRAAAEQREREAQRARDFVSPFNRQS